MKFKTFIDEATRKPEHTHAVTRGGNVISYHTSSKSAHKKADSLDNKYGSTVHSVKLLESEIYEMIPYALSAANANAEHARHRKAKEEEEKRKAKEQLDKDSEDNSNPFANVKESNIKVGQRVKFNEPVAGTTRHSRKPMSFDGGKVVQVTPTHAIVRPQAWHGDEGLDVHVPHKNIKEENKKRQVEPPPEAMASDTRIKPLPKKGKRTTGSFNKFGNFTPGMKEEVEQVDENDYSRRRKKEEDIISGKKPARKKIPMGSDYAARYYIYFQSNIKIY